MLTSNKFTRIFVMVAVLVLLVVYFVADMLIEHRIEVTGDHAVYEKLEDLEQDSTLIISATVIGNQKNVIYSDGAPELGYTKTEVMVQHVYKGDSTKQGTVYSVAEPYYSVNRSIEPGRDVIYYEGYTPLINGSRYILFINDSSGINWIHALYQGKYNIDNTDMQEQKLWMNIDSIYSNLRNQVLAKYK